MQHMSMAILSALTLTAFFMSHPVSITLTIIMQTLMTSIIITTTQQTPWFSYILFLVFLGGMLVLFSYITSLSPNFTFKPKMSIMMTPIITLPLGLMISKSTLIMAPYNSPPQTSMNKLFFQEMNITLFLAVFLLIILFVVVQITSNYKGPLQTKM